MFLAEEKFRGEIKDSISEKKEISVEFFPQKVRLKEEKSCLSEKNEEQKSLSRETEAC